jgi:predicted nuclease of predicted toxin-antitoxin system
MGMRFLADMGVGLRIVDWLRKAGHDAVHLRDQGLQRLPNGQIFAKAKQESRVILTFDLDFGEIVALSGGEMVSVVLFRLNNTSTPFVIGRLSQVLADAGEALHSGAIVVVEDHRHRIRRLPLGG